MNYYNYQIKRPVNNYINNNIFNKKKVIPRPKNYNKILYNNCMTNYNQYTQNYENCTKLIPDNNYISTYNLKSYGNIDKYQDFDILKIKMSFDYINQKINNMENIIQSLNKSNAPYLDDNINNKITKIPTKDKIRYRKEFVKENNLRKQNKINENKSIKRKELISNNISTHHNYSVQNLKNKIYYNNYINDSVFDSKYILNEYNNNYSLKNEKSYNMNKPKYNSSMNLNVLDMNNRNIFTEKNKSIDTNYNKSSYSLNNNHIFNQKKTITKKIISNKNFFNNINKIPNLKNNKTHQNKKNN